MFKQLKLYSLSIAIIFICLKCFLQQVTASKASKDCLWGVATATYQVEGTCQIDGKEELK